MAVAQKGLGERPSRRWESPPRGYPPHGPPPTGSVWFTSNNRASSLPSPLSCTPAWLPGSYGEPVDNICRLSVGRAQILCTARRSRCLESTEIEIPDQLTAGDRSSLMIDELVFVMNMLLMTPIPERTTGTCEAEPAPSKGLAPEGEANSMVKVYFERPRSPRLSRNWISGLIIRLVSG